MDYRITLSVFVLLWCFCQQSLARYETDPDLLLNAIELIRSKGYPAQEYNVQTKDGYILTLHRIPNGRPGASADVPFKAKNPGSPIFLQHGFLSSSVDWIVNFPHQSLGFLLADAGYDVWLGNFRGNVYSRRHVSMSPDNTSFWQFSFDEMISYDLPAMIDFVLAKTNHSQLHVVGHSEGTTTMMGYLSQSEEHNQKVKLFAALAPVATVGHIKTALKYFAPFAPEVSVILKWFGDGEFLPNNYIMKILAELFCDTELKFFCSNVIFLFCGVDKEQLNMTRLPVYVAHAPAGSSTLNFLHYVQMVNSKKFVKFDYGNDGNMQHYGQVTPPEYHVENITTSMAIFWSLNDYLADPTDVALLIPKIKNLVLDYFVPYPKWDHIDFVWGMDAAELVYTPLMKLLSTS